MNRSLDAGPRSRHVEISGLRHHLLEWGDARNEPLLLIHGFTTSTLTAWRLAAPRLAERFHVTGIDLRGHGESSWDPDHDYTLRAYFEDMEKVLEHVGLQPRLVIGHSLGGRMAVLHVARNPGTVRRLVLVEARMRGGRRVPDILDRRPESFPSLDDALAFARKSLHEPGDRFRYEFIEQPDGTATWRCDLQGIRLSRAEPDELLYAGQWHEYETGDSPTLSLVAGRSSIRSDDLERMRHTDAPVRIATYRDSGHSLHLDEPERFLADVSDFFDAAGHGISSGARAR